jgi:hypothetical protein
MWPERRFWVGDRVGTEVFTSKGGDGYKFGSLNINWRHSSLLKAMNYQATRPIEGHSEDTVIKFYLDQLRDHVFKFQTRLNYILYLYSKIRQND